ncbi:hypothetical protein HYALB_00012600 [Hymenoscyphus albidus]|uniref:Uncharacterized protein n=1 Tax=Hymenoscyphus albidus TaxID=595503 RepID=A0A9N9PXF6_9HELO|nr:hypothetical protein HYALB_00012600 [Hymenoscyphus albidus]
MQFSTIFLTMGLLSITMAQSGDVTKTLPGVFPADCPGTRKPCKDLCAPLFRRKTLVGHATKA